MGPGQGLTDLRSQVLDLECLAVVDPKLFETLLVVVEHLLVRRRDPLPMNTELRIEWSWSVKLRR
jgi:hypothetical protein